MEKWPLTWKSVREHPSFKITMWPWTSKSAREHVKKNAREPPKVSVNAPLVFFVIYDNFRFFVKYDNLQKLSYLNMTISIWQLFKKFSRYVNLQYDNFFEIFRNMTILIFLHFWDAWIYITFSIIQNFSHWNCHIWNMTIWIWQYFWKFLKYDNQ